MSVDTADDSRRGEHRRPLSGSRIAPFRFVSAIVLVVSMLAVLASSGLRHGGSSEFDNQREDTRPRTAAAPVASPVGTPHSSPAPAATPAVTLSPAQLLDLAPNELGVVPILEYHMITTNRNEVAQFVRHADDMRADLMWLYTHNFYIVPLRDVVNNTIAVPAGKHPVALTFDDGTSSQFSFIKNAAGELVPDPDTAIGILEAFSDAHPDFGRGGHFGLLVFNGFAHPDETQEPYLKQKIEWMVARGYEIGNHTWQHTDLTDIPTDAFLMTVAEPMLWADTHVGDVPENQSRILTLPYGTTPDGNLHPDQRQMMRDGFIYKDQELEITAALLVGAEPAKSPASALWDPMWVPRIQMFDESVEFWFEQFESGGVVLYTSDGNADTIVVPHQLPPALDEQLDVDALIATGKLVIRYDAETGIALGKGTWRSTREWHPAALVRKSAPA